MRSLSGRTLAVGIAGLAVAGSVVLGAPAAQAATTGHCTTVTSGPGFDGPTLTSIFFGPLSNCGGSFTNLGAPYTFALDNVIVPYLGGTGIWTSGADHNLIATCTSVSVNNAQLYASGCTYAPES